MTSPIAYQNKPLKGFDTAPEFLKYRRRGEYRVIRCDFPQLMGWSTLRRPPGLPRSLKTPYFAGEFAPLSLGKERIYRPHVNRIKLYKDSEDSHMTLMKNNIILKDGPPLYKSKWGELRVANWKGKNKEILVRMYNKNSPHWMQLERKMLKEVCHVMDTGHPNFLQYYGVVENAFWKYHLSEYMPRGDLLSILKKSEGPLDPEIVRKIFVQIVYAVSHLHDKDIVHRNLKLENILVGLHWEVRIIDITHTEKTTSQNRGDASNIAKTTFNHEYGPIFYRGPERVLKIGFNPLLDQVWGLGVLLYSLFFKKFPFNFPDKGDGQSSEDFRQKIEQIVNRGLVYPKGKAKTVPVGGKIALKKIFTWERYRPRTFELLDDPWLSGWNEAEVEKMKNSNAIGRFTHEHAEKLKNEPKRMLLLKRRMFKHFKLFREDYTRQPTIQGGEVLEIHKTLGNAQRFLGPTSYGVFEVKENVMEQHKAERLYKEEYWPVLYAFNPIKCKYLGINRLYCKPRTFPVQVNLERLADKNIVSYGLPPPRRRRLAEEEGGRRGEEDDDDVDIVSM
ncbi:calcium/calmodulin-dependent protein kinase [Folsomia candida]|nr:calcium/calmodulin-dependent protein kinase [Folsomia candida]